MIKKDVNFIRAIQKEMLRQKEWEKVNKSNKIVDFIIDQIQKKITEGYVGKAIKFELNDEYNYNQNEIVKKLKQLGFTAYYSKWTNKFYVAW